MVDTHPFTQHDHPIAPAYKNVTAITPNDDTDLTYSTLAIRATGSGNIRLTTLGGQTVTIAVAALEVLPVRAVRVLATSTTATGLFAFH